MNAHVENITAENAQALLIDESFKRPVLIDFWAEWCGPCKSLMPVLEKLANEYQGQFLLAKVNADEQQMIAGQFGVRSLPTVMIMKDGQPVDGFAGAQPEQEVRKMLEKHLPSPADLKLQEAEPLIASGEFSAAFSLLKAAYEESNHAAKFALPMVHCLIELKRYDEAEAVLGQIKMVDQDAQYEQLLAQLDLAKEAKKSPEITVLEQDLQASPEDQGIKMKLAVQYNQSGYQQDALTLLFSIIQRNMGFADGEAKKMYLDILATMEKSDPVAVEFQRKLYTLLY